MLNRKVLIEINSMLKEFDIYRGIQRNIKALGMNQDFMLQIKVPMPMGGY
jgi:hypothetical protein